jgi:predicted kinase
VPELVILVGLPGAGKTSFYRERFAATHVQVSKDVLRNRGDKQARQLVLIEQALAAGRSVVVDNVNATVADRAALIAAGRRHAAPARCYVLTTTRDECLRRNRARTGREHVPAVAIHAAAKRFDAPAIGEGFEDLWDVRAEAGGFAVTPREDAPATAVAHTIFLLSPASTGGERGALLFREGSGAVVAARLRAEPAGVPLGEVFSFLSSLYFRGKLTYARAFGRPPAGLCGAFVITPSEGLRDPAEPLTLVRLRRFHETRIRLSEPSYLKPLLRDAEALRLLAGERTRMVLLGSIASERYVEPLLDVFGERLVFPPAFVGRGDMSRGGLLLRCVDEGRELEYAPVAGAMRHGPRPPRLVPRRRPGVRSHPARPMR